MNYLSPIITRGHRTDPYEHYCSCLFKLRRRTEPYRGYPYNVCTSTIFNRRGLRRGERRTCLYTQDYLESLKYNELWNFAYAKEIINGKELISRENLIEIIKDWLQREGSFLAK